MGYLDRRTVHVLPLQQLWFDMSAQIINLRTVRKARARAEKERLAEQNRAKFGRSKQQQSREARDKERASRALDGAKREHDAGDES